MKRQLEGCLRSEGLTGSRPRKAAMRKCSIIGCLLLLLLSNCSTATDLGGDTYRRICTLPGRHAHGGRLWLPRCGSGRGRNGQSYSTITPVRGKWASDIKCSTHSCSYRVLSVTATPPIQTFRGFCLIIFYYHCRCCPASSWLNEIYQRIALVLRLDAST